MAWLCLYFTGSTEAGLRGAFTTAYHKGNMKMYLKRKTQNTARTGDNEMPNLWGKKMMPFLTRQLSIFMPMFEDQNIKERRQENYTTREKGKGIYGYGYI